MTFIELLYHIKCYSHSPVHHTEKMTLIKGMNNDYRWGRGEGSHIQMLQWRSKYLLLHRMKGNSVCVHDCTMIKLNSRPTLLKKTFYLPPTWRLNVLCRMIKQMYSPLIYQPHPIHNFWPLPKWGCNGIPLFVMHTWGDLVLWVWVYEVL